MRVRAEALPVTTRAARADLIRAGPGWAAAPGLGAAPAPRPDVRTETLSQVEPS